MDRINYFSKMIIKNENNKYIVDEFIRYYKFLYSNYTTSNKSSKEIYYKIATVVRIIETIAKYSKQIVSGSDVGHIKGIGEKTIARIDEIIETGKLSEIKEKQNQYEAITELSSIYGIGATKASIFYEQYNIKSINDLIKASKNGTITLTHQMILGIKYKDVLIEKIPHNLIEMAEKTILNKITAVNSNIIAVICGSYRREKDFSSDMDILLTHPEITNTNNKQGYYLEQVVENLADKNFFIIDKLTESSKRHFQGFASFKKIINSYPNFNVKKSVIRIDIIIVPYNSFYTALMHFTGSAVFNQKMRLHAKSLNMKLSEYGLFKQIGKNEISLHIHSEKDIFDNLLLKYIAPNKR